MRETNHIWLRKGVLGTLVVLSLLLVNSCVKVIKFNPPQGAVGTTVVIEGRNFGATAAQNTVKFSGVTVPPSEVLSASKTEITNNGISLSR